MLPFRTILCPLDFSESSYKALHNAAEVALHFQAELIIVHVVSPVPPMPADPAYMALSDTISAQKLLVQNPSRILRIAGTPGTYTGRVCVE